MSGGRRLQSMLVHGPERRSYAVRLHPAFLPNVHSTEPGVYGKSEPVLHRHLLPGRRSPRTLPVVTRDMLNRSLHSICFAAALVSACSSSGGTSTESADAAVAAACGVANQQPQTRCPMAAGGSCYAETCNLASLPTGMACSSGACAAAIDPCGDLAANGRTDYYACACSDGHWVCGLCEAGASACVEAGVGDSTSGADASEASTDASVDSVRSGD